MENREWNPAAGKKSSVLKKCIQDRETRLNAVCFILTLLMFAMLACLFVVAIYLDVHPRLPIVVVYDARVADFSLHSTDKCPFLSSWLNLDMQSSSEFRIPYEYSNASLGLSYAGSLVSNVQVADFRQNHDVLVNFTGISQAATCIDRAIVSAMASDVASGKITLRLHGNLRAEFQASRVTRASVLVPVDCTIVLSTIGSNVNATSSKAVDDVGESSLLYRKCARIKS